MPSLPRLLSTKTCVQDLTGPGRSVKVQRDQGCHVKFDNGWTVSIQWSAFHYCSAHNLDAMPVDVRAPAEDSPDAEVAAWKRDGDMIELDGDSVAGWQPVSHVLAALEAAARDDEDGIRSALVREASGDL